MEKGRLYIVSTPIGNLGDITYRGIEILKSMPFVLAEDTRVSKKLFDRYGIQTQLISYRDQNHIRIIGKIKEKLDMGLNLALISDSGTPLISDPGYKLVRDLRQNGYPIESIPGPSALISALSISGFPTDRFVFLGFLPKSNSKRKDILIQYLELGITTILYESPNRVIPLLENVSMLYPSSVIALAKDITKFREEFMIGNPQELMNRLNQRSFGESPHGEFVVLINTKCQKE